MNHTDTQLKQVLAKMLPESIAMRDSYLDSRSLCRITTPEKSTLCWISNGSNVASPVLDTELLHLCWLVEELFIQSQNVAGHNMDDPDYGIWTRYLLTLKEVCPNTYGAPQHATYEQRTIALAKVKGIEIV